MDYIVEPIKVLVIDDSATTRRIICGFFDKQEKVVVSGTASSGEEGLIEIDSLNPDIVTLDIEMPGMNGTETLRQIKKRWPRLPVIMLSAISENAAKTTLEALEIGASDYIAKPSFSGERSAVEEMGKTLLHKVVFYAQRARNRDSSELDIIEQAAERYDIDIPLGKLELVVVVQCEGNPTEVVSLLDKVPKTFSAPLLFAQQMPRAFSKKLVERIAPIIDAPVSEVAAGARLQAGTIYVAPGDMEVAVSRTSSGLSVSLEPAFSFDGTFKYLDPLLKSVAGSAFGRVLVVMLEGAGIDGVEGLQEVVKSGGTVMVQIEPTESIAGTAEAIAATGISHHQAPLAAIAALLIKQSR